MQYKKKLIGLCVIVFLLTLVQVVLPYRPNWTIIYADYIFVPFQSVRNIIFGWSQLSFGDLFYFVLGLFLVILPFKWLYYLLTVRSNVHKLTHSILNTIIFAASVYLLFLLGWGGNYYKPSLTNYWHMDVSEWNDDSTELAYDRFLSMKLNEYAGSYQPLYFMKVRKDAMHYYKEYTDCKARLHGLNIKPSVYGYLMQHLGIQGYYNPITGEAQVNRFLPPFMLPFVVLHEMAHQAGIAAEDDANLLAYTISVESEDTTFRYSAYLNMWLYNHGRLRRRDSVLADEMKAILNPLTLHHLDTLHQIRERYKGDLGKYSTGLYDTYLKMLQQKEGIGSYNRSVITAWAWEQNDTLRRSKKLPIP
ncbi:MAG: DUF3810 family protein [Chitinophagaceae bacterium]|nr:DUF3810 family protein [Chitinophagaceae bacterium]MCB9046549.1 DUF3810 family protein [Chitinophagales bacterium]